jgi:hypothetical protein
MSSPQTNLHTSQTIEAIAIRTDDYLMPVMDLETAKKRLLEFQQFVKFYLKEGEDFGVIPGTPKPTLLKPGADKLCELYGLADTYPDNRIHRVEDWSKDPPLFDYEVTCVLIRKGSGIIVGEGMGSCNSYEGKYRWRDASRKCPKCNQPYIIKGKEEYGGGWICFAKKGGCGAKFKDDDATIVAQQVGRIPNPDIADIKNTILKMAKKRAKIDATIASTRSSGIFTQDLEDIMEPVKNQMRNFTGQIRELKQLDQSFGITLKKVKPILWIKNEGIFAQLGKVEDEEVTLECIERQGHKGKYWEVIRVLRIGEYDFSDENDLTSALKASVENVSGPEHIDSNDEGGVKIPF